MVNTLAGTFTDLYGLFIVDNCVILLFGLPKRFLCVDSRVACE